MTFSDTLDLFCREFGYRRYGNTFWVRTYAGTSLPWCVIRDWFNDHDYVVCNLYPADFLCFFIRITDAPQHTS